MIYSECLMKETMSYSTFYDQISTQDYRYVNIASGYRGENMKMQWRNTWQQY